jgi:hypothetical protein
MRTIRDRVIVSIVIVAVIAGASVGIFELRRYADGSQLPAGSTAVARTPCDSGALQLDVEDAHFAAFIAGSGVTPKEGKFLIVVLKLSGASSQTLGDLRTHVVLVDATGRRYEPVDAPGDLPSTPGDGQAFHSELLFDVPRTVNTAKLTYDDGCMHQEWPAP